MNRVRIDYLDGTLTLDDVSASAVGVAMLNANPAVDLVIVAGHDAQGVPQEWTVKRSEAPGGEGWLPVTTLTSPASSAPQTDVVHDQGDRDGLEGARAAEEREEDEA